MFSVGFRPRRSLMFCSWGAEEYGLIGSVEYVQVCIVTNNTLQSSSPNYASPFRNMLKYWELVLFPIWMWTLLLKVILLLLIGMIAFGILYLNRKLYSWCQSFSNVVWCYCRSSKTGEYIHGIFFLVLIGIKGSKCIWFYRPDCLPKMDEGSIKHWNQWTKVNWKKSIFSLLWCVFV
jgi:hypothetical protein